jgi:hypothetical protein
VLAVITLFSFIASRTTYNDGVPFSIHETHSGKNKCYTCHQTTPQLFNWPKVWLESELSPFNRPTPTHPPQTKTSSNSRQKSARLSEKAGLSSSSVCIKPAITSGGAYVSPSKDWP